MTIIDLPTFEALKESMGADFMDELLQAYFDETPQLLSTLGQTLDRLDYDSFQRAAHSIKSTSNSFGALEFGLQAKELEMMGKARSLEGARAKVEALVNGYGEVHKALEDLNHG